MLMFDARGGISRNRHRMARNDTDVGSGGDFLSEPFMGRDRGSQWIPVSTMSLRTERGHGRQEERMYGDRRDLDWEDI